MCLYEVLLLVACNERAYSSQHKIQANGTEARGNQQGALLTSGQINMASLT